MSPALADGFLTTGPAGKSPSRVFKGEHQLKAYWARLVHLRTGQKRFSSFGISLPIADICWQVSSLCQEKSDIVLCKRNARNGALHQITTSSPLDGAQPFLASLRGAGHALCALMSSLGLGLPYQELRVERCVFSMGSSCCLLAHESSFSPSPLPHYLPKQKIQS